MLVSTFFRPYVLNDSNFESTVLGLQIEDTWWNAGKLELSRLIRPDFSNSVRRE
jgi:hypothetical protein